MVDDHGNFLQTVGYAADYDDAEQYIRDHENPERHRSFFDGRKQISLDGAVTAEKGGIDAVATLNAFNNGDSPQQVRHTMRRMAAFEQMFGDVFLNRVEPGVIPHQLRVTWEEFQAMHNEYKACAKEEEALKAAGRRVDHPASKFPFQPLSAYANKLVSQRKDGTLRVIRNPVQNEVGFWTDRNGVGHIVILKDQGPGDLGGKYHQVPSNIES
jgi:hypothetical protein